MVIRFSGKQPRKREIWFLIGNIILAKNCTLREAQLYTIRILTHAIDRYLEDSEAVLKEGLEAAERFLDEVNQLRVDIEYLRSEIDVPSQAND